MTTDTILYGMPGSLYTAKVRSYLRKQRIPFEERSTAHPTFRDHILPMIGRWIIPVLQTPDGTLVQDGSMIIDHLESLRDHRSTKPGEQGPSALPPDPLLRVLAHLFELFGGEGLLRPAMHYRWNFDADNLEFLRRDFTSSLAPAASATEQAEVFAFSSSRMRGATKAFGVNSETIPLIEQATREFLTRFDQHLATTPYLLGTTPSHGDYGLLGPLHAHLGRDPYPTAMIKQIAPRVWRWIERMNAPDEDAAEYLGKAREWVEPEMLAPLLAFIAEDYLPEIQAHVAFINAWLADRPGLLAGTSGVKKPSIRSIGVTPMQWRGLSVDVMVMPYRLLLLQRIQDATNALNAEQSARLRALFQSTGLETLLDLRCRRRVMHQGFSEVWGPDSEYISLVSPTIPKEIVMSDLDHNFQTAVANSKTLSNRPDNATMLKLYALYKQGSVGDAPEEGPDDMVGMFKHKAWTENHGMSQDDAKKAYIALVESLQD
jgi:acyl-CoA-binding protein/glutathione S-transferase